MAQREHMAHLDGLRGAMALWVLLSHLWLQEWPILQGVTVHGAMQWTAGWLLYAHFAVDVFIVLSGYCLMLPVARKGSLEGGAGLFMLKRAVRILPPFYMALALSAILCWTVIGQKTGTHWDVSLPVSLKGLEANLLLMQDVFCRNQYNHAFWSIAVEWKIYLLFPLLVWAARIWGTTPVCLGFASVGYGAAFVLRRINSGWSGMTPHYLALFCMGCLAADWTLRHPERRRYAHPAVMMGLAALVTAICLWKDWYWVSFRFLYVDALVGAAAGLALLYCSRDCGMRRALSWKPLVKLGAISYSLYLIHAPLLQLIWQFTVRPLHLHGAAAFALLLAAGAPAILAATFLFYRAVEWPCVAALRRLKPQPPSDGLLAGQSIAASVTTP